MRETFNVTVRKNLGTRGSSRVRDAGQVPAILYGHGEANLPLAIPKDQVWAVVRHGGRLVDLAGEVKDTALIRQVQWDAFGVEVLHVDLSRVSAGETVEIVLPVELKGSAAGLKEGGVVEHVKHELKIQCPVLVIPEKLFINVNSLHLNQSLYSKDVTLPEGAELLSDPNEIVVHCVPPMAEVEGAVPGEGSAEPEVIGRKKEDEAAEAEEK